MAEVEILDVVSAPLRPEVFWGAQIDFPTQGERREHYALVVAGWVASRFADGLTVEVFGDGRRVARWKADLVRPDVAACFPDSPVNSACGYMGVIRTLELPPRFELQVEAVGDAQRFPLGVIRGRRSSLRHPVGESLRAAPLITLGRTGSSFLMLLLGQHPQLIVHPPFPFEARVMAYWTSIFQGLSSPASYLQALAPLDDRRFWWAGHNSFTLETYIDQDAAARSLGGSALEATASLAQRQVVSFYENSAALQRKPLTAESCFVEKQVPNAVIQRLQEELFPRRREIFLVRDFRDMLTSILAFNHKRDHTGFGRDIVPDEGQWVDEQGRAVEKLLASIQSAGERGLLVRYEDLLLDPRATLARILRFLEVDGSAAAIADMRRRAERADAEAQQAHRTTVDPRRSIGRWKTDLPPRLRERCQAVFGEALADCGYEAD